MNTLATIALLLILGGCAATGMTLEIDYTDSGVGCIDDCLEPMEGN